MSEARKPKRRIRTRAAAAPSKPVERPSRAAAQRPTLAPRTVVVGTLCVVAAAALVMGRPSVRAWVAEIDEAGQVQSVEPLKTSANGDAELTIDAPAPVRPSARPTAAPSVTAPVTRSLAPTAAAPEYSPKQVATPQPVVEEPQEPKIVAASLRSAAPESAPTSAPAPVAEAATPVTITGCLQRAGDGFALTDTSGDAPRSRSWKSGFLRRRSSSVAVTDRGYTHRLASYVGQRLETTGVLVDHEMRVKTLRVLGSCE